MPIPDYQTLMLPLLRFAADGNDHTTRETVDILATEFQLTPAERRAVGWGESANPNITAAPIVGVPVVTPTYPIKPVYPASA